MKNGNWDEKIRTAYDHATPDVLDRILSACEEQKGNLHDRIAVLRLKKTQGVGELAFLP